MVPEIWLAFLHLKKGMKDTFCEQVKIQKSVERNGRRTCFAGGNGSAEGGEVGPARDSHPGRGWEVPDSRWPRPCGSRQTRPALKGPGWRRAPCAISAQPRCLPEETGTETKGAVVLTAPPGHPGRLCGL